MRISRINPRKMLIMHASGSHRLRIVQLSGKAEQTKHSLLRADLSPMHGALTNSTSNSDNLDFHRHCLICTSSAQGSLPQSDCIHADRSTFSNPRPSCFDMTGILH